VRRARRFAGGPFVPSEPFLRDQCVIASISA
jgi:hypothetical protein